MKRTGFRKKALVIMLTAVLLASVFTIATSSYGQDGPLKVSKTVWDGSNWVDEINAAIGDTVTFNITIENVGIPGEPALLYEIWVNDTLPDILEYVNGSATINDATLDDPIIDGKNLSWFFPVDDVVIDVNETLTILFDANVTGYGSGENVANVSSKYCGDWPKYWRTAEDNATVNVREPGKITVTKKVKNETSCEWLDEVNATIGDDVRFNITVSYDGDYILDDICVEDILPPCLNYSNNASPEEPEKSNDNKTLWWNLTDELADDKSVSIEFNATVVSNGTNNNTAYVTAREIDGCYTIGILSGEANATVEVPDEAEIPEDDVIDVIKKVKNKNESSGWLDEVNATVGDTVRFNITITNNGETAGLYNITVNDTLPDILEYVNGSATINGATLDDPVINGQTLLWSYISDYYSLPPGDDPIPIPPGKSIYIEFDANVTGEGREDNIVNVTSKYCTDPEPDHYDEDNATVNASKSDKGKMIVTKTVKNETSCGWMDEVNAYINETMQFKITVYYEGSLHLYNISIVDTLPECLEYDENSSVILFPPYSPSTEPNISYVGNETLLLWDLLPYSLTNGSSVSIEFNATVVSGGKNINIVNVTAIECGIYDHFGNATAIVNVTEEEPDEPLDIDKKVWNGNDWVDEVNVSTLFSGKIRFKIAVSNNGENKLFNVTIIDKLPDFLKYEMNSSTLEPIDISGNEKIVIWLLGWLESSTTVYIEFNATIVVPCCDTGVNIVNVTAEEGCSEPYIMHNASDDATVRLVQDVTKPDSHVDEIEPYWHNEEITVTATANDPDYGSSGIRNVALYYQYSSDNEGWTEDWKQFDTDSKSPYEWNFNFSNGTGYYRFYSIAEDRAFNEEVAPAAGEFDAECGYDTEAPTTTINLKPKEGWYTSDVTITLTADDKDDLSNVAATYYIIDDGAQQTGKSFILTDGIHEVKYWSVDNAGNVEAQHESGLFKIDKTSPTVDITKPKEGRKYFRNKEKLLGIIRPIAIIYGDITIEVTASDATSGIDKVEFYINGNLTHTDDLGPAYSWKWNTRFIDTIGKPTIKVTAYDEAGNSQSKEVKVKVHLPWLGGKGGTTEGESENIIIGNQQNLLTQQKITVSTIKTTSSNLKTATTYQLNRIDNYEEKVLSNNHHRSLTKV